MRKNLSRILFSSVLLTLLAFSIATPVLAFDGREGDNITIGADEVINDDLYVGAGNFTLDGTVKGDVFAGGQLITINGTVEGDVIAAGQAVVINGTVTDDVRIAGGALLIGEKAQIGGDIISAGASLEFRKGATVGQDVVFFGGQALLAGEITRNVDASGGGVEIRGTIGGDVKASVGDPDQAAPGPMVYMPNSPIPMPNVKAGLTIDPEAKIAGKLEYETSKELNIPGGVVHGPISHIKPIVKPEDVVKQPTLAEKVINGFFDMLRNMITLFLLGLVLVWLFPNFVKATVNHVRNDPLPSIGWGAVSWAACIFSIMLVFMAMLIGGIIFGAFTLGSLSSTIVWTGILAIFTLALGFALAAVFISKIVLAILAGKLILKRVKPEWSEHKIWPLALGVILLDVILFTLLAPLPPFLGWVINLFIVALPGLGALWLYGRDLLQNGRPTPEVEPQPAG